LRKAALHCNVLEGFQCRVWLSNAEVVLPDGKLHVDVPFCRKEASVLRKAVLYALVKIGGNKKGHVKLFDWMVRWVVLCVEVDAIRVIREDMEVVHGCKVGNVGFFVWAER
jgi:hypothetical protein